MAHWLQGENAQMRSQDWFLATCGGEAGGGLAPGGPGLAHHQQDILCGYPVSCLRVDRIGKGPAGGWMPNPT